MCLVKLIRTQTTLETLKSPHPLLMRPILLAKADSLMQTPQLFIQALIEYYRVVGNRSRLIIVGGLAHLYCVYHRRLLVCNTMFYEGFIFGNWEQRALLNVIEDVEVYKKGCKILQGKRNREQFALLAYQVRHDYFIFILVLKLSPANTISRSDGAIESKSLIPNSTTCSG